MCHIAIANSVWCVILHQFCGSGLNVTYTESLYCWGQQYLILSTRNIIWILDYPSLYRHTEDMIKKLESAGLGFYVRDSQQKLGNIPVLCIPVPYSILVSQVTT